MKKAVWLAAVLGLVFLAAGSEAEAEKGRIRVSADREGAYIYVNGQKKAMTGTSGEYTDILLPEGEYEIKVEKETSDGDYVYRGMKKVFVGADTSVKIEIETKKTGNVSKIFEKIKFVLIQPGTFMMGSPADEPGRSDKENQHKVTISKPFYMQATEVTQAQWKAFMGDNPSEFAYCGNDCPVEKVSWDDVQQFIRKLNQMTGQQYRLPTDAEWEYACRAGTTTPFYTGRCLSADQANYNGNYPLEKCSKGEYRGKTVSVASFPSNAWGLYDMHGNVWEWCQDYWYDGYPSGDVTDPAGPSKGSLRVRRGGSWFDYAQSCRSAYRYYVTPDYRDSYAGFRLARSQGSN